MVYPKGPKRLPSDSFICKKGLYIKSFEKSVVNFNICNTLLECNFIQNLPIDSVEIVITVKIFFSFF